MRLLNAETLQLELFLGSDVPEDAILSHTGENQETLFDDIRNGKDVRSSPKEGLAKVTGSCEMARDDGFLYIWIDTCCIDKSSSTELSEAINSMFAWYQPWSRWFSRGWTLQERLAPSDLVFYSANWEAIGNRKELAELYHQSCIVNDPRPLSSHIGPICSSCTAPMAIADIFASYSVATRMSWAAKRHTTRIEDIAYCLLGMFDVHMPLLYGEGKKAFLRLQE
ncbi:hypothetical protein B0H63DRAFT_535956 [Podospora didyma]|uniref:Heterokaryon incompatibility domain-containing protein n=1 Tax=Podospora didyma TaxID=330526 RepID=A0AAE0N220_9PEZI|nr:hypothetical protein B0H63DRAFT_535956 [Podospora didyma]